MCKFASFVLTRNKAFWSDISDSHESIIAEHKLHTDGVRGVNVLRVELTPPDHGHQWADVANWSYHIDQDIMPDWFDAPRDEERARDALATRIANGWKWIDLSQNIGNTIKSLPDLPAATTADLRGCTGLTTVDLPAATTAYLSGCTGLTTVPKRKGLRAAK